jgi:hypothetical protein
MVTPEEEKKRELVRGRRLERNWLIVVTLSQLVCARFTGCPVRPGTVSYMTRPICGEVVTSPARDFFAERRS